MPNAVIFVPTPTADRWIKVCAEYATSRRYTIVAVVSGWTDAVQMVTDGHASVLVVAQRDHLHPRREPRMEVVTEMTSAPVPGRRRPWRSSAAVI